MYGENYQGEIPGWIYIHGLDQYYLDPAYWTKFYQDRGILPKPASKTKLLFDDLTNLAIAEAGKEIVGSLFSNSEGGIFSKLGNALGLTDSVSSSTGGLLSSVADIAQDIAGRLGNLLGIGSQAELFNSSTAIGQTLSGKPLFPGQTFADASKGSLFSRFTANPLANAATAALSGYSAYKAGKPTTGGWIAAGLTALSNPIAGIITAISNLAGGLLGKRRKKRKIKKWASRTADRLVSEFNFPDRDALLNYLKGNYKKFSNNDVFSYLDANEYSRAYSDLSSKIRQIYEKQGIDFTPDLDLELKKAILDKLLFNMMKERRFMNLADRYGLKEVEDLLMSYLG